jgi:hypothetical protein
VKELVAASGFTVVKSIGSGFDHPGGVAVDGTGNLFVADTNNSAVKELTAASGFAAVESVGSGFTLPAGVAVDVNGNVFVADPGAGLVQEVPADGGSVKTIASGFVTPQSVALDPFGNAFVADAGTGSLIKILAAGGYQNVTTVASSFADPGGVAIDGSSDAFIGDSGNNAVKEVAVGAPLVVASVLPGSRSVQIGKPATLFATIINTGATALSNCAVALPPDVPAGLSLAFQTTNPATNTLTGAANTPVTIAGNDGLQSFLITFQGTSAFDATGLALIFGCVGTNPATIVTGVDTIDLAFSTTPIADVVALAATATNNGIVELPPNGAGAFAVASSNVGATATLTVSVDTGAAILPVAPSICQTNPANGQCLAAPSPSVTLTDAAGAVPTFSIFLTAEGTIPFAPASSRIFVRFKDASGTLHGSTSVAVETN